MAKFKDIVSGETPVLVDFFAEWCGPCKTMAPILSEVKSTLKDGVKIIKIDTDKNPNLARDFQVRGVPTLILFQNGQIKWRQSGVISAQDLQLVIANNSN
jgi:thioredoxin 1